MSSARAGVAAKHSAGQSRPATRTQRCWREHGRRRFAGIPSSSTDESEDRETRCHPPIRPNPVGVSIDDAEVISVRCRLHRHRDGNACGQNRRKPESTRSGFHVLSSVFPPMASGAARSGPWRPAGPAGGAAMARSSDWFAPSRIRRRLGSASFVPGGRVV